MTCQAARRRRSWRRGYWRQACLTYWPSLPLSLPLSRARPKLARRRRRPRPRRPPRPRPASPAVPPAPCPLRALRAARAQARRARAAPAPSPPCPRHAVPCRPCPASPAVPASPRRPPAIPRPLHATAGPSLCSGRPRHRWPGSSASPTPGVRYDSVLGPSIPASAVTPSTSATSSSDK